MNTNTATAGELSIWQTPKCYFGFDPVGHVIVMTRHRESSILANSNWWIVRQRLESMHKRPIMRLEDIAHDGPFSRFDPDNTPLLYDWRASDSLVGWIEYLMIRPCAEVESLLQVARGVQRELDAYPILDEDDYSERQQEAMENYWNTESLKQRIDWCQESGTSIFSSRMDYPPERVELHWNDLGMFA